MVKRNNVPDADSLKVLRQVIKSFDKKGNLIQNDEFELNKLGLLSRSLNVVYKYNAIGQLLGRLIYNDNNQLDREERVTLNSDGQKVKSQLVDYVHPDLSYYIVYEYNEEQQLTIERLYDSVDRLVEEKKWTYNVDGDILTTKFWALINPASKRSKKKIVTKKNTFDRDGNLIKAVEKKQSPVMNTKEVYYFHNNHITSWKQYEQGRLVSQYVNEYRDTLVVRTVKRNKRGRLTESLKAKEPDTKPSKKEIWMTNSEYDDDGKITKSVQYLNDKEYAVSDYAYDVNGNLILKSTAFKIDRKKEVKHLEYNRRNDLTKVQFYSGEDLIAEEDYSYSYFDN